MKLNEIEDGMILKSVFGDIDYFRVIEKSKAKVRVIVQNGDIGWCYPDEFAYALSADDRAKVLDKFPHLG